MQQWTASFSRISTNKKIPDTTVRELQFLDHPREKAACKTADHSPDRVSLLHKGGFPICNSGCGDPIVERVPSSVGQLPVPTALNAGSPTLFRNTIHDSPGNVNPNFSFSERFDGKAHWNLKHRIR